jgi:nucleoside-diphosphate-sugar epimerase
MPAPLHFVTGATGLIGSHVAERLVARGERVRALVRPASDVAFLKQLGVELALGDLQSSESLRAAVAGADTVYHCAARVGYWGPWRRFRADIVDATSNLMQACRAAGVRRVLHVSSVLVYGYRPRIPPEGLSEDQAPHGRHGIWAYYGRAKMEAEEVARELFPDVTIVRPTWVFGPRDRNALPRLVLALRGGWVKIIGAGDNLLNVIHAADVAAGAIAAASHAGARGQAYHLCSAGEVTQRQFIDAISDALTLPRVTKHVSLPVAFWGGFLAELIARLLFWQRAPYISRHSVTLMGRPAKYRIDKAKTHFNWQPQINVLEGLKSSLAWIREHDPRTWSADLPSPYVRNLGNMGK